MSSRFVSAGAVDAVTGKVVAPAEPADAIRAPAKGSSNQAKWEAVERELEEGRRKREAARAAAATGAGEQSLFDILQANKAAKDAAFEEERRLKNQFRPLDEDEADFLESILESSRADEERVRRETQKGLEKFRQDQKNQESKPDDGVAASDVAGPVADTELLGLVDLSKLDEEGWRVDSSTGSRKRKRRVEKATTFKGLKRKSSTSAETETEKTGPAGDATHIGSQSAKHNGLAVTKDNLTAEKNAVASTDMPSTIPTAAKPEPGLLVSYDSDEDD